MTPAEGAVCSSWWPFAPRAMNSERPGLAGAAGTLELLIKVLKGEDGAVETVEPFLHTRAKAFEDANIKGGIFEVPKSSALRKHYVGEQAGIRASQDHAGASNVLRNTGASLTETLPEEDPRLMKTRMSGQLQPSSSQGKLASETMPPRMVSSRSSGSLKQSGSGIAFPKAMSSQKPNSTSTSMPFARPSSGQRSSKLSQSTTADLDTLRAHLNGQLTSVITWKSGVSGTTTPSTTLPRPPVKEEGMMDTPMMTSRSQDTELTQENAFNMVSGIVETCVELEQAQNSDVVKNSDAVKGVERTILPSTQFSSSAALAAVKSAEAASRAAMIASQASQEAADEAAKCVAAARAATGQYNSLVDWAMIDENTRLALEDQKASMDSEDELENDGINQAELEREIVKEHMKVDLQEYITMELWQGLLIQLDLDAEEGVDIYEDLRSEYRADPVKFLDECEVEKKKRVIPPDPAIGIPLIKFVEDCHIDTQDRDGLEALRIALDKAKKSLAEKENSTGASNGPSEAVGLRASARSCFNKIVRAMDYADVPAKRAWQFVQEMKKNNQLKKNYISMAESDIIDSYKDKTPEFVKQVEEFMENPPVMNASGGQTACKQICSREVNEIIDKHKKAGTKFTDPEWDMTSSPNEVLYVDKKAPGYDCTVAIPSGYKRLSDIVKKGGKSATDKALGGLFGGFGAKKTAASSGPLKPILFKGAIKAGDIVQGQIGTCFLLGAIGAMASHKEKDVEKIFIKYDVDVGVYGLRFNVDGEWRHIIIDDWFPVDEAGRLLYSSCKEPQEVWVPLLEKAFCKLHTCYEMCDGGEATEALNCFFGGVFGKLTITKHHRKKPRTFFKLLQKAKDKGWLLTTSFVAQAGQRGGGGAGKCGEDMLPCGLVGGHCYSVLKIVEAEGNQLICCRNPWGNGEWTGKWGDNNSQGEWTKTMKDAVGYANVDDGKFWMSVQDFVQNSGGVNYARTFGPNWKKATRYCQFSKKPIIGTAKRDYKGKNKNELSFSAGDQIRVRRRASGDWWTGNIQGDSKVAAFRNFHVKLNDRPVLRFDIVSTPDPGSSDPVTVVIMLIQRNIMYARKVQKMDNGMNYKDTTYPEMELVVVRPDGEVAIRKKNCLNILWGEVTMPGGGLWRIYALSSSGEGQPCSVRTYIKGGTMTFKEHKGATFAELQQALAVDEE